MTALGRRTPATPEHAGCVSGASRISGKETASPVHPGCAKRVAVQRDALGARGAPVKPSREAPSRPSAALGARGARGRPCKLRYRDPPTTPGA